LGSGAVVNAETRAITSFQTWVRLGRLSNLPTVWTNAGTAYLLSTWSIDKTISHPVLLAFMACASAFYVAGMILNDAFDADYDATFRAMRPIPQGEVSERTAFVVGFGLLAVAVLGVALLGVVHARVGPALVAAGALALTIITYDAYHKGNPASPLLMGFCRSLVYLTVASTLGALDANVLVVAALQFAYVVGLTYAAKQEDLATPGSWWPLALLLPVVPYAGLGVELRGASGVGLTLITLCGYLAWLTYATRPLLRSPRNIGVGVGRLIAGVAALDAVMLSTSGSVVATAMALFALAVTRMLHRIVPGT
jgi:hypothetical protein